MTAFFCGSMSIIYGVLSAFSLVAPVVVTVIGPQLSMFFSGLMYRYTREQHIAISVTFNPLIPGCVVLLQLLHCHVHLSVHVELLWSVCACWIRSSRYTKMTVLSANNTSSLLWIDSLCVCFSLVDSSRKCADNQLYGQHYWEKQRHFLGTFSIKVNLPQLSQRVQQGIVVLSGFGWNLLSVCSVFFGNLYIYCAWHGHVHITGRRRKKQLTPAALELLFTL